MKLEANTVMVTIDDYGAYSVLTFSLEAIADCRMLRIPRMAIEREPKVRDDVALPGIYIYIGQKTLETEFGSYSIPSTYIGQTGNITRRKVQHDKKDNWDWTEMLVLSVDNVTSGLLKQLESDFINMFRTNRFWHLRNKQTSEPEIVSDYEKLRADRYFNVAKTLMYVAGFDFMKSRAYPSAVPTIPDGTGEKAKNPVGQKPKESAPANQKQAKNSSGKGRQSKPDVHTFYLKRDGKIIATAESSGEGFTVKSGSESRSPFGSLDERYLTIRAELMEKKVIVRDIFRQDYTFNSPSQAAAVVCGHNTGSHQTWRDSEGRKFGEVFPNRK